MQSQQLYKSATFAVAATIQNPANRRLFNASFFRYARLCPARQRHDFTKYLLWICIHAQIIYANELTCQYANGSIFAKIVFADVYSKNAKSK